MRKSKLTEHKQNKRILFTPFNNYFGDRLELKSWQLRLPELLWLGIIIYKYGHTEGLIKCHMIIDFMEAKSIIVKDLKITTILDLDVDKKEILFDYINTVCENKLLDGLCLVIDDKIFRNKFYNIGNTIEDRIKELKEVLKESYFNNSNLGCDIRFLYIYHLVLNGKIKIHKESISIEALKNYYNTEHTDSIMGLYRSSIRALEIAASMIKEEYEYSMDFWSKVGNFSECELYYTNFEEVGKNKMKEFYDDVKIEFQNLMAANFGEKNDDKFIVITGLFAYATKILNDVCNNNLYNTVSSRILLRTVIDIFVNIKYLTFLELENPNVWKDFQKDGLGKYKLIYKKIEEKQYNINAKSHLPFELLEIFVNDGFDEEFMDINLGYFEQKTIKSKFEEIGEKELYDTLYDYDVSYAHAFWGAIRESSMLKCDNVLHQFHVSADNENRQMSKSTEFDYILLFVKIMKVISSQYKGISTKFFEKYEVKNAEYKI